MGPFFVFFLFLQAIDSKLEILQHAIENPRVGGSIPSLATTWFRALLSALFLFD